ncbi:MAG: TldD/PmbA family protein [Actinomycetota bacterium]
MTTLLGASRMSDVAEQALAANADGSLVTVMHSTGGLTRFASSRIHQNTHREDVEVRVLAIADGNKIGVASAHSLDPSTVKQTAEDALSIARVTPANEKFAGLSKPAPIVEIDRFDAETASATPAVRAEFVSRALAEFSPDMEGAGAVETVTDEVFILSTTGVRCYGRTTRAAVSVMAMTPDSSGYAEIIEASISSLDPVAIASRAVRKADMGRAPMTVEPGSYTVVLEPAATSTLMQFMGFMGFGAKAFLESRSFMSEKIGQKIVSDSVTIIDDPLAPDALGLPFDFEGTPSQKVALIEKGVATGVVWDLGTAREAGRASTGHALPPPNPDGPFPLNLRMLPGTETLDSLIAGVERGLLVTRFHYSNVVNEKECVLTGMTRDGTFLISDGALKHGVRNLRYTQNTIEALNNVTGIGDHTEISSELFFGGSRAPALRIENFKFSSNTDH